MVPKGCCAGPCRGENGACTIRPRRHRHSLHGGCGAPVHHCDRLAADATDSDAVTQAVSEQDIKPERAIQACEAALNEFPNTPRFQAQLGRAFFEAHQDEKAVEWWRKAAEQGYSYSMYSLGWMYAWGRGASRDDAQAVVWLRKAAEQGSAAGQSTLGWMYEHGRGVAQDRAEAKKWYQKAASQGLAEAKTALAQMPADECDRLAARAYDDDDDPIHPSSAIDAQPVIQACNAALNDFPNTPRLQAQLGWALYRDRQYEKAVEWLRKAAEQGNALGQRFLGVIYFYGLGLPRGIAQALAWWQKAAEQGDALTQLNLGGVYILGVNGVPRDYAQGLPWVRKAAEQGNTFAQRWLKDLEAERPLRELLDEADVKNVITLEQLSTNPFVYSGKKVLIKTTFQTMLSRDTALFGSDPEESVLVSGLPPDRFTHKGDSVLLVGRVQGKDYVKVPMLGEVLVPHLGYVDAHICQEADSVCRG